jgi:hypothetical protein
MNTYYLRTIDYPTLLTIGVKLGVLQPTEDGDPVATDCGYLDYIGEITRDEVVITNPAGIPYIHANLITPHDLRALAIASTDPEIQAALADIAAWFIVDEQGNAVAPQHPHRIFG